jgi:serine phosphatase RsbU (regulator of sigma subunit)
MMKPCELVSGDFFWAATFNEYQVFCMTDCTGHGVPGAFMSILGISALDEIVNRHRVTKPSEILGYLRQSVIEALSQNDPEQLHKDGMDISLCVLNTKTRELQFAGAGQHLWMVIDENSNLKPKTDSKIISHNGHNLFEVKGDTMPVGQSPLNNPFVNHSISLADNAANIYLVTDGFADQLNDSRMKYGAKRLKTFILSHCDKPMADQNQILVREFENWMGSSYQVDDVTVMGIRLA